MTHLFAETAESSEENSKSLPIPTRVLKANIHAFAEKLRVKCNLETGFELIDLVHANGGQVNYIGAFSDNQTDSIVVQPDDSFEIKLSSSSSSLRDNFTLAHELGHYILHWPKVKESGSKTGMRATRAVDYTNDDLVRCEWEANWFAAAFLMPKKEFSEAVYSRGIDYAASLFGVSKSAAKTRAQDLGIEFN